MQSLADNRPEAIGLQEGPLIGSLASLDDMTLLALILSGRPFCSDPHRVAADLFDRFGGLAAIASADLCELSRIDGVGPAVMTDLKLLRLLCERMSRCEASRRPVVSSWSALLAYVRVALVEEPREQFRTLFLDRKNQLLRDEMVSQESAYRPDALSPAGAGGLTQLMPGTALELGVGDRFDPAENLRGGADYLARQLVRFGDLRLALAAYNAGPGRVARLGRVPDFAETRTYVATVIECFLALTAGRRVTNSRQCASREGGR